MDIHQISITDALKATAREEGGRRYIYMEASNESLDVQGEVILAKALKDSAEYYLKYGNLDLDHKTQILLAKGDPGYSLFELGKPIDVKVDGKNTFVKGEIYSGTGPSAKCANEFWDSLTNLTPAMRWYPSVGGQVLRKSDEPDPKTGKRTIVSKVRWTNIGFSKTPVNLGVDEVSSIPMGVFAKAWDGDGFDLAKALTASGGTDSATLTGGSALRVQSLDPELMDYYHFRESASKAFTDRKIKNPGSKELAAYAKSEFGRPDASAADWAGRFMAQLSHQMHKRSSP